MFWGQLLTLKASFNHLHIFGETILATANNFCQTWLWNTICPVFLRDSLNPSVGRPLLAKENFVRLLALSRIFEGTLSLGLLFVAAGCSSGGPSYSLIESTGDDVAGPRIHCAVEHVCAIELKSGQRIRDMQVGSSSGWTITRSTSGENDTSRSVLMIEATDKARKSNILITTNEGTLNFQLIPLKNKSN